MRCSESLIVETIRIVLYCIPIYIVCIKIKSNYVEIRVFFGRIQNNFIVSNIKSSYKIPHYGRFVESFFDGVGKLYANM